MRLTKNKVFWLWQCLLSYSLIAKSYFVGSSLLTWWRWAGLSSAPRSLSPLKTGNSRPSSTVWCRGSRWTIGSGHNCEGCGPCSTWPGGSGCCSCPACTPEHRSPLSRYIRQFLIKNVSTTLKLSRSLQVENVNNWTYMRDLKGSPSRSYREKVQIFTQGLINYLRPEEIIWLSHHFNKNLTFLKSRGTRSPLSKPKHRPIGSSSSFLPLTSLSPVISH